MCKNMQVKYVVILVFILVLAEYAVAINYHKQGNYRRYQKSLNRPTEPEFDFNSVFRASLFSKIFENDQRSPNVEYVDALLGQDVLLPCKVRNLGSHNILWLRLRDGDVLAFDNMTVTQDNRFRLEKRTEIESNLIIRDVKLSDSGDYACQINTPNLKSKIINLNILKSPVFSEIELTHEIPNRNFAHMALSSTDTENIINFSGEDYLAAKSINVVEGRQISLECNAFGRPKPTINWYVKRFKSHNLTVYILNSSKIFVNNVMREQYDYFECEATNRVPPSISKKFKINVLYRPEVTVEPSKVYVMQFPTQVRFNCTVNAFPSGEIMWMFKYRSLRGINYYGAKQLRQINRHSIKHSRYRSRVRKMRISNRILAHRKRSHQSSLSPYKYRISEQILNETIKKSSIIINVESENDFGSYECYSNNTAGSKFAKFYIYGETKPAGETFPKNSNMYTPIVTTKTTLDFFTEEIIMGRKDALFNQNKEQTRVEQHVKGVDFEQTNDKVINFSTNIADNSSPNDVSLLEYILGNSNEISSSSKTPSLSYLPFYFNCLNFLFIKKFFYST